MPHDNFAAIQSMSEENRNNLSKGVGVSQRMSKVLLLFVTLCSACFAQTAFRVSLVLSIDNTDLKNEATSYITRELRSIPDVQVTDNSPLFTIYITGLSTTTRSNVKNGFALAELVTLNLGWLAATENVSPVLKDAVRVVDHEIMVGADDDLEQTCKELVASFDSQRLEPARKLEAKQ